MKNTAKRFLSLAMALCMSLSLLCVANAANTSETSGGSASSRSRSGPFPRSFLSPLAPMAESPRQQARRS